MKRDEAIDFLSSAVGNDAPAWADLGAGSGTFTEALAHILGPSGTVFAVDSGRKALGDLRRLRQRLPNGTAALVVVPGDLGDLASIPELDGIALQGALMANVLHFFAQPERILALVARRLASPGRLVVVEYDRADPNPWVPHPVSSRRLGHVARAAGLGEPRIVAERPSRFGTRLYCALLASG